ncbi:hypothetical protein ACWGI8_14060 [Streptomyces sp. NPDC054841]
MRRKLMRAAVVGSAVAAAVTFSTAAAVAGDITISNSHGSMKYIDDGDMFQVCDTKADGYGMKGQLISIGAEDRAVLTVDDGGDAGCDKKGYNVGNGAGEVYKMALVWNGGGDWTYSYHFKEGLD